MKFAFSQEQHEYRSVLRRFLVAKSTTADVRRLMETEAGYDKAVWQQLANELGLTGIHIPEIYGGQGFGVGELSLACEEMGRALLCAPFFASTVLGATAILEAGSEEQKKALLPGIAAGDTIATLAVAEAAGKWEPDAVACIAEPAGEPLTYRLRGEKRFVPDGTIGDLIVVAARVPGGTNGTDVSLFTVAGSATGLGRQAMPVMDPTRKLATLSFDNVEAQLLGEVGRGAEALARVLDTARICLANEMVGGTERLFEDALAYAKMRVQFGRAIASFQSLKHKAADMLLDLELAKSGAYYAAAAIDEPGEDDDTTLLAALAKSTASDAYMNMAVHAVQIHGGIGFTWDNDTHLWFKRAKASEVFLGQAHELREVMMQRLTATANQGAAA